MFDWIRRALLALVGLSIPLESVFTFDVGGYPVGLNKATTGLLLAFAFFSWPLTGQRMPPNRKHLWVLAFAVSVGVGTLQAVAKGFPLGPVSVNFTAFVAVILFYYLVPFTVTDRKDLGTLLWALVLGVLLTNLWGLLFGQDVGGEERYQGSTGNPNAFAFVVSAMIPLMFAFYFGSRSIAVKGFLAGTIAVSTGGVLLSLSRAALLSIAAMGGLWVVRFRRVDTIRYLIPAGILAVGVVFLAPQALGDRLQTLTAEGRQEDGSIQHRMLQDYWGVRAFLANPAIGQGLLGFGVYAHERDRRVKSAQVVHNAYLGIAAGFGLLGFVPFLGLTILTWWDYSLVWRTARDKRFRDDPAMAELGQLAIFLQIGFLGCIIGGQFHPTEREKIFWLLMGLSSVLVTLARARYLELKDGEEAPETEATRFEAFDPASLPGRAARALPR